jgi:uncharacterized protein (DUF433 family)
MPANRTNIVEIVPKSRRQEQASDPRDIPIYRVSEVARSLRMREERLLDWTHPQDDYGHHGERFSSLIEVHDSGSGEGRLSFFNVVEAHILLSTRDYDKVPMLHIRRALEWIRREIPAPHPLIEHNFETNGKHLFLRKLSEFGEQDLINVSTFGQRGFAEVLDLYLRRIRRDNLGFPVRLFPLSPDSQTSVGPEPVMMDLAFASGDLVITDTGIRASVAYGRYLAGEPIERLARNYRIEPYRIQAAIDYLAAAAA